jgi:hypothetical protein
MAAFFHRLDYHCFNTPQKANEMARIRQRER